MRKAHAQYTPSPFALPVKLHNLHPLCTRHFFCITISVVELILCLEIAPLLISYKVFRKFSSLRARICHNHDLKIIRTLIKAVLCTGHDVRTQSPSAAVQVVGIRWPLGRLVYLTSIKRVNIHTHTHAHLTRLSASYTSRASFRNHVIFFQHLMTATSMLGRYFMSVYRLFVNF